MHAAAYGYTCRPVADPEILEYVGVTEYRV